MHRPGVDPDHVSMTDVLCDFCQRSWTDEIPMVEGHQGACICGRCLAAAWVELVHLRGGAPPADAGGAWTCRLCLEGPEDRRSEGRSHLAGWPSPIDPDAIACGRCVKQAAGVLHKDPDWDWRKPEDPAGAASGDPTSRATDGASGDPPAERAP